MHKTIIALALGVGVAGAQAVPSLPSAWVMRVVPPVTAVTTGAGAAAGPDGTLAGIAITTDLDRASVSYVVEGHRQGRLGLAGFGLGVQQMFAVPAVLKPGWCTT
jgi:hypothetical protein